MGFQPPPPKKKPKNAPWQQKTNTGRVVYDRKKHSFRVSRIVDICIAMTKKDSEVLYDNAIGINALFQVVKDGLYPYYLDVAHPKPVGESKLLMKRFVASLASFGRRDLKAWAKKKCREIGEANDIPDYIIDFVLAVLYDKIFDMVWRISDIFFGKER